uniref:OSJNBa0079F16.11 protein n=1 Tax=Oryza sativa subsp. japonica TaxID=39947 RepID=Q7XX06_ORYSJ|nr:OSJNBa0079F16.11 [Oryza sativa Japonica Group]
MTVDKVCGGVKGLDLVGSGKVGLEEQGAGDVVQGTKHALGLTILWGGVRAGHPQGDSIGILDGTDEAYSSENPPSDTYSSSEVGGKVEQD